MSDPEVSAGQQASVYVAGKSELSQTEKMPQANQATQVYKKPREDIYSGFKGVAGALLVMAGAAALLGGAGMTSTSWSVGPPVLSGMYTHHGLWEECRCRAHHMIDTWLLWVQILACLGLGQLLLAFLPLLLHLCHAYVKGVVLIMMFTVMVFASAVLTMVALLVFSTYTLRDDSALSWSFWFVTASCCISGLTGCLSFAVIFGKTFYAK